MSPASSSETLYPSWVPEMETTEGSLTGLRPAFWKEKTTNQLYATK